LPVADGREDESVVPGRIYIAPPGRHMVVSHAGSIKLLDSPKQQFCRPAVDPLFASLADRYRQRVIGTILTGYGRDGVDGLRAIAGAGGYSIAQQPAEAEQASMPLHAIRLDHVNFVGSVDAIAKRLQELAAGA
jgi:two-component system chemotaxis response regulator CheB